MSSRTRNRTRTSPLGPGRDFRFTIRERKERELNPQGTVHARPASNRFPSPIGWPFRCLFHAPTRTRTQNIPLEAGHDFHFTIEATVGSSSSSGRQGIRTLTTNWPHSLANRPGKPYPATFRNQWTHRESNPECQPAELASCRLTMSPFRYQWTAGELNPDYLVATQMSCRWTSSPYFERSVRELTRASSLPRTCAAATPTDRVRRLIPDGVEPSSPACRAGVVPLDHGIEVTEVGVEPTNSPGSRPGRFSSLRTRS